MRIPARVLTTTMGSANTTTTTVRVTRPRPSAMMNRGINAAIGVTVRATVQYDDGTAEEFVLSATHAGDYVVDQQTAAEGNKRATQPGSVVNLRVRTFTAGVHRGACAVVVLIIGGGELRDLLARGYVWSEGSLGLGEFNEFGPTGGAGDLRSITVAATALGQAAVKTLQTVPATAIWRIHRAEIRYGATATVGNRNARVTVTDGTTIKWRSLSRAPTASQTAGFYFSHKGGTVDTNARAGAAGADDNVSVADPSLPEFLGTGYVIRIDDAADIQNSDTVAEEYTIEEWVVV